MYALHRGGPAEQCKSVGEPAVWPSHHVKTQKEQPAGHTLLLCHEQLLCMLRQLVTHIAVPEAEPVAQAWWSHLPCLFCQQVLA